MQRIDAIVVVKDRMQHNYQDQIVARVGEDFMTSFEPRFTPAEMLALGVFECKYCNDCRDNFPDE